MPSPYPISDLHIHIQPWRQLKPAVMEVMRKGKEEHWARLIQLMEDPAALLEVLDASGIDRVGLINYPEPRPHGVRRFHQRLRRAGTRPPIRGACSPSAGCIPGSPRIPKAT
jgi:hypothetical protein